MAPKQPSRLRVITLPTPRLDKAPITRALVPCAPGGFVRSRCARSLMYD
jgi:hypothetical protein